MPKYNLIIRLIFFSLLHITYMHGVQKLSKELNNIQKIMAILFTRKIFFFAILSNINYLDIQNVWEKIDYFDDTL